MQIHAHISSSNARNSYSCRSAYTCDCVKRYQKMLGEIHTYSISNWIYEQVKSRSRLLEIMLKQTSPKSNNKKKNGFASHKNNKNDLLNLPHFIGQMMIVSDTFWLSQIN